MDLDDSDNSQGSDPAEIGVVPDTPEELGATRRSMHVDLTREGKTPVTCLCSSETSDQVAGATNIKAVSCNFLPI